MADSAISAWVVDGRVNDKYIQRENRIEAVLWVFNTNWKKRIVIHTAYLDNVCTDSAVMTELIRADTAEGV